MIIFRRGTGGPGRVTVQEAALRTGDVGSGADAVLLDVREAHEWQAGHAPRAAHVPLAASAAGAGLPGEGQARPPVVICRSGNRSRRAAELPAARGAQAVDVIGGMRDGAGAGTGAGAGLPVVDARGGSGTTA